jgi:hypothetical protein
MDLRRERKRSLKVCEQQEAEFERIEASKKRYGYIMLGLMIIVAIIIHHRQCQKFLNAPWHTGYVLYEL